jgi:hypothetical protein
MFASGEAVGRAIEDRSTADLEAEITSLHSRISAESCRWLLLVAEYDRREAYRKLWGARHMADWLSWHCGVGVRAAHEQVRVARALVNLPLTTELFAKGELSYSKVRAISRAFDGENEASLLNLATNATAAQLERLVSSYRRAKARADEDEREAQRFATWEHEDDGCVRVRALLSPDEGAILVKALELAKDEIVRERSKECEAAKHGREGKPRLARATNADALVRVAEGALAGSGSKASGGDATQLVVHVDLDALDEKAAKQLTADGRSELDGGQGIATETAQRLACDAAVVTILERGGEPLSVGRKTRSISPALRRALRSRDGGCRFPGCSAHRFIDGHHVKHWAKGGATELENLISLCRHHHRLVHEGGFAVEAGLNGEFAFIRKNGSRLPAAPPLPGWKGRKDETPVQTPEWVNPRLGVIGPCAPQTGRHPLDLDLALFCLFQKTNQRADAERRGDMVLQE